MEYRPCTAGGHHNVTSLNLKGDRDPCSKNGFREVFIRCNGDEVVEFIRVRFAAYLIPTRFLTSNFFRIVITMRTKSPKRAPEPTSTASAGGKK